MFPVLVLPDGNVRQHNALFQKMRGTWWPSLSRASLGAIGKLLFRSKLVVLKLDYLLRQEKGGNF